LPNEVEVETRINLQLTGKILLMLDSNSNLLLEYDHEEMWQRRNNKKVHFRIVKCQFILFCCDCKESTVFIWPFHLALNPAYCA